MRTGSRTARTCTGTSPTRTGSGDTYGPLAYYSYVPFELAFPWSGMWDDLPAAHAAAIAFDLATMLALSSSAAGCSRAGRQQARARARVRMGRLSVHHLRPQLERKRFPGGAARRLALLAISSPRARGAAVALAAAAKFAPLALVPLWASYDRRRARDALAFALAFGALTVLLWLPVLPDGGVRELWDRTVGFQLGRDSPFSIWGLEDLGWAQDIVKVFAVMLAVAVAVHPRVKTPLVVAALGAAALIGLQLALSHWFYLYIVWWLPLAFVALLAVADVRPRDGTMICSNAPGEAVVAYVDHASHHPWVLVGGLELDWHLSHKALDDLLPLHADHTAPCAGHADIRDEGGALREDASIGGRDVVWVPSTASTRPSRCHPIATFSLVVSAWKSTTTTWPRRAAGQARGRRRGTGRGRRA